MGIVFKQSLKNTIIIYLAFAIGGINVLFLYPNFLSKEHYGLVVFLLSTANLLMPLTAFGVQYAIIKYYSSFKTEKQQDQFLSSALLLPILVAIPIGALGILFYERISLWLSVENEIIKEYTYFIYIIALLTAYFEVFYAWSKVQLQSVFGNFVKEMFTRISVMILLVLVYFKWIEFKEFIYLLTASYLLRMLVMMSYAFYLKKPKFTWQLPENYKEVFQYAFYIILAGSASSILLDIDKFMIPGKLPIEKTAFYAVALFIGSVIEAPGRAMAQIVQPLTAKALNENNTKEIESLYKKSSINLFLISGLVFLIVNVNIKELYTILPKDYSGGVWIVLMISTAKLYHMVLGNNGAIISNSKYYRILLPYAVLMALSVIILNYWLIGVMGINGAALSTLVVIMLYNTLKIWYVKIKFGISPFTNKSFILLLVIVTFFFSFYFWDVSTQSIFKKVNWNLPLFVYSILNIAIKSFILGMLYLFVVIKLKIAPESIQVWDRFVGYFTND